MKKNAKSTKICVVQNLPHTPCGHCRTLPHTPAAHPRALPHTPARGVPHTAAHPCACRGRHRRWCHAHGGVFPLALLREESQSRIEIICILFFFRCHFFLWACTPSKYQNTSFAVSSFLIVESRACLIIMVGFLSRGRFVGCFGP